MDKLIVIKGETTESEFQLSGSTVTIGRDDKQDITIKGSLVSRRHARIEKRSDGWHLIDAGSANGTSVNGERIDTKKLAPGDTLEIGNFTLRLVSSEEAEEKTVLLDDDISSAAGLPAAAPPPTPPPTPPEPAAVPPPTAPDPAARPPVESTIYLSDNDESPAAAMFGSAPTAEEAAVKEEKQKGKSKTGIIIAAAAVFLLLFFLCLCGLGFVAVKKGWIGGAGAPVVGSLKGRRATAVSGQGFGALR